jgi:hypothetical protein
LNSLKKKRYSSASEAWNTSFGIRCLQGFYVIGRGTFSALLDIEAYTLTFMQGFKTAHFYSAVVNKDVSALVFGDEAVTLAFIKPFDRAFRHTAPSFLKFRKSRMHHEDRKKPPDKKGGFDLLIEMPIQLHNKG